MLFFIPKVVMCVLHFLHSGLASVQTGWANVQTQCKSMHPPAQSAV